VYYKTNVGFMKVNLDYVIKFYVMVMTKTKRKGKRQRGGWVENNAT